MDISEVTSKADNIFIAKSVDDEVLVRLFVLSKHTVLCSLFRPEA
jgi:hypothetical protein